MLPGRLLHRLATFLIPADLRERVLDAQLADLQYEVASVARPLDRGMALARGYVAYVWALVQCLPSALRPGASPFLSRPLGRLLFIASGVGLLTALAGLSLLVRTGSVAWGPTFFLVFRMSMPLFSAWLLTNEWRQPALAKMCVALVVLCLLTLPHRAIVENTLNVSLVLWLLSLIRWGATVSPK